MRESYELIEHLREAQDQFFEKNGLEGAFWRVDLYVYEMDSSFTMPLKEIVDKDRK